MGSWGFSLFPDAAEGGGSFRSAVALRPGGWTGPPSDSREDAAHRARTKVRRFCAANRLNRLGTLTYAGAGNHDPAKLREDVGRFFRRLRGSVGGPFPYLWVPEWHPGGHGLHVHFAVGRFIPVADIRETWGAGIVHIKLLSDLPVGSGTIDEARRAAGYLSKYLGKDLDQGGQPSGLHRYEVAEGFQPVVRRFKGETWDEVLDKAAAVMGAEPTKVWDSADEPAWDRPHAIWAAWS
ncbi:MAG TPA: hypothetical protein VFI15_12330 [Candidatus Limnocylindrales bacterium]|nr:hypothetical protein [Candidatus Limnocylindrales bacterium]